MPQPDLPLFSASNARRVHSQPANRPSGVGLPLSDQQMVSWLRLIRSENVGPQTFRQLINRYGSATNALEALPDLARRGGAAKRIRIATEDEAISELEAAGRLGARFVAWSEAAYPRYLLAIDGPPPLLAVAGSNDVLARPMVGIVGSRNASLSGRKLAAQFAAGLGREGFVIVSGLARGIDAAAHEASVATGTVGVLAGGLDRLYPPENEDLARRIRQGEGALISEMPFGWEPRARDFPRRNRLISGVSLGIVVVEAAVKSGSLHTARFAAEQGREVFAVPGSPLDPRAEGTNELIRNGATLIGRPEHIIEALAPLIGRDPPEPTVYEPAPEDYDDLGPASDDARRMIVEALGVTPISIDDLLRETGLPPGVVQMVLLELNLAGRIERHGHGRISLLM